MKDFFKDAVIPVNPSSLKLTILVIVFKIAHSIGWSIVGLLPAQTIFNSELYHVYSIISSVLFPLLFVYIYLYFKFFLNQVLNIYSLDKILIGIMILTIAEELISGLPVFSDPGISSNPQMILGLLRLGLNVGMIVKLFQLNPDKFAKELKIVAASHLIFQASILLIFLPASSGFLFVWDVLNIIPYISFLLLYKKAYESSLE